MFNNLGLMIQGFGGGGVANSATTYNIAQITEGVSLTIEEKSDYGVTIEEKSEYGVTIEELD